MMKLGSGVSLMVMLTSCSLVSDQQTVSSMNFLQTPIDANCAVTTLLETEGYAVETPTRQVGDAVQIRAQFNQDMPITGIVRTRDDGTGEVSFFTKLEKEVSPLERREAEFAVRQADEVVYRACTEDGKRGGDDVVIQAEE